MANFHRQLLSALIVCALFCSGCTMLFSRNKQKVTVKSGTPGATIYYHNDSVGNGRARIKLNKLYVYQGITVVKDGYKTLHYGFQPTKLSPAALFGILDMGIPIEAAVGVTSAASDPNSAAEISYAFGILGGAYLYGLELSMPKVHRYEKVQQLPALVPIEKRAEDEKYMLVNNVGIDAEEGHLISRYFKNINDEKPFGGNKKGVKISDEALKVGNTVFTKELNNTLYKMNFVDTTGNIFPNVNNAVYLDAKIKKITFNEICGKFHKFALEPNSLLCVDLEIEWDLLDFYKQKIYSTRTKERSDLFLMTFKDDEEQVTATMDKTVKDNLEYALIKIRKEFKDKGYLKVSDKKVESHLTTKDIIALKKPMLVPGRKFNDFYKNSVSINAEDNISSGVIVSDDGYIIASMAGIGPALKIEIFFSDTSKATASIVRKDAESGLTLLKVEKTGLSPFLLSEEAEPEIGGDVWAIGTPGRISMGQSVTKGIISGIRKSNGVTILQTDASLNKGNFGGALISKDGLVQGINTSKLSGVGTEGIGFAVLAKEAMERLGLRYK